MARPTKANELKREVLEDQLTCLGTALVLINLITHRIGSAMSYTGQVNMLSPAIEDLDEVKSLLVRTQVVIRENNPDVFAVGSCSCD